MSDSSFKILSSISSEMRSSDKDLDDVEGPADVDCFRRVENRDSMSARSFPITSLKCVVVTCGTESARNL